MTGFRHEKARYSKPWQFKGCYANSKAHGLCTGCGRKHFAFGYCRAHREQLRKGQLVPIGQGGRRNVRWMDPKGDVSFAVTPTTPNARSTYGWIAEHVLVMSELLGRPLRPGESVHHRNLIKGDNCPENLELWTSHQPKGARVADMLVWCHWFIGQYSDAPEWTSRRGGPLTLTGAGTADTLTTDDGR